MLHWLVAITLGAVGGVGAVGSLMLHQATERVEERLAQPLWRDSTRVMSSPVEIWEGLHLSQGSFISLLEQGGWRRGDGAQGYSSGGETVVLEGSRTVVFRDGVVAEITPGGSLVLPPIALGVERGSENEQRTPRASGELPLVLKQAVLAMEDSGFYQHHGFSPLGILRAAIVNLRGGRQGGSTLTQQLAKNLFLTQTRSYERKLDELFLSMALERELEKEEILNIYLNEIYWGQVAGVAICGAEAASQAFFGKPAANLTTGEAATLAGIISSPNRYNPLRHPERAQERRDITLNRMVAVGVIDRADAEEIASLPLLTNPASTATRAPWTVDLALESLEQAFDGTAMEGATVWTTAHPVLQELAEEAVALSMEELLESRPESREAEVALVAIDNLSGAVVAMVGGRNYGRSQYNRALNARRQVGSTVKPLTLLTAFESDRALSPATLIEDSEISRDGGTWRPQNHDDEFLGVISLREALARSRNIPAVLLSEEVGLERLEEQLDGLGLSGATALPSTALGAFEASPIEVAGAYQPFATAGVWNEPYIITGISDPAGEPLEMPPTGSSQVFSPRASTLALSVLESVIEEGTGRGVSRFGLRGSLGGKTGTTNGGRDAWFAGVTPRLSVAVWVGVDSGDRGGLSGSVAALPIWARFVKATGTASGTFPRSDEVVEAPTCLGGWSLSGCEECGIELFTRGEEPEHGCEARGFFWGLRQEQRAISDGDGEGTWPF